MFKLFFIYPVVALVIFWLASDVKIEASLFSFDDNSVSIEFPKKSFRSADNPNPWYSFYWNADSARESLHKLNDAVVK